MKELSKFKLFKSKYFYNIGSIYAIVTGSQSESSKRIEAEWFYVTTFSHKKSCFKMISESFETIDQFWDSCVIEHLKDAIYSNELIPVMEQIQDYSFCSEVDLQKIEVEKLAGLSFDNMDFIDYLKKHTVCSELKKFADIFPIIETT